MSNIIILRGPYCAGKTTWALKYCTKNKNSLRVCMKDILKNISGEKSNPRLINIVKNTINIIIFNAIKNNIDVIIDDEHMLQSSIDDIYKRVALICKSLKEKGVEISVQVKLKEFNTPFMILHKRNKLSQSPRSTKAITKSYLYYTNHR